MSWLLILISLLPDIIDVVMKILNLIRKKPVLQRGPLKRELFAVARKHVAKKRSGYALKTAGVDVRVELEAFLEKVA